MPNDWPSRQPGGVERPETLFGFPQGIPGFDVTADGEQFVILTNNPEAPAREIRVIQNFFEELKQLVGN